MAQYLVFEARDHGREQAIEDASTEKVGQREAE